MGVGHQARGIQIEFPLVVHVTFVHRHTHHLGNEHIVASQLLHVHHPAFQIHRAFPDPRGLHVLGRQRRQLHFLKYELTYNKSDTGYILDKLKNVSNTASGAYTAGYDWCYYFERPANKAAKSESRGYKAQNTYWPEFKNYKMPNEVKPTPAPSYKLGDVNSDGKVNSSDALEILRYSVGIVNFNANQFKAGDLDRSGIVNANDARIVLLIATGSTGADLK